MADPNTNPNEVNNPKNEPEAGEEINLDDLNLEELDLETEPETEPETGTGENQSEPEPQLEPEELGDKPKTGDLEGDLEMEEYAAIATPTPRPTQPVDPLQGILKNLKMIVWVLGVIGTLVTIGALVSLLTPTSAKITAAVDGSSVPGLIRNVSGTISDKIDDQNKAIEKTLAEFGKNMDERTAAQTRYLTEGIGNMRRTVNEAVAPLAGLPAKMDGLSTEMKKTVLALGGQVADLKKGQGRLEEKVGELQKGQDNLTRKVLQLSGGEGRIPVIDKDDLTNRVIPRLKEILIDNPGATVVITGRPEKGKGADDGLARAEVAAAAIKTASINATAVITKSGLPLAGAEGTVEIQVRKPVVSAPVAPAPASAIPVSPASPATPAATDGVMNVQTLNAKMINAEKIVTPKRPARPVYAPDNIPTHVK